YDWDWGAAESAFRRALALDPDNVTSRTAHSLFLAGTGRMEESIREARRAVEIDPLFIPAVCGLGVLLVFARKCYEAIVTLNRALELDGRSFIASNYLALAYEAKGERAKAIEWAENSGRIAPLPVAFSVRGWLYGLDGRLDEAQRMLDELKEQTKGAYVS